MEHLARRTFIMGEYLAKFRGLMAQAQTQACFFFNDTATTDIYTTHNTLSLHDALPITPRSLPAIARASSRARGSTRSSAATSSRSEEHTSELPSLCVSSYAVFCLKKKNAAPVGGPVGRRWRALRPAGGADHRGRVLFFNDTGTTEIYTTHNTLSLHDALPI